METVFEELTMGSQQRYAMLRRKVQFFSTFAGGVIEALRESGYRLSNFRKETPNLYFMAAQQRQAAAQQRLGQTAARSLSAASGGENIELSFEQRDNDQCRVLIVPYRNDLPYLFRNKFTAQLGLELSRYTSDPDVLRKAMNVNTRGQFGSFIGGARLPKLYIDSPPALRQPGSMTFELQGARLVVAMNIVVELGKYRISDFDLNIDAIRTDLEAYFYGLEKYLSLLLKNFGSDIVVEEEPAEEGPEEAVPPAAPANTAPQPVPQASQAQTMNLSALQVPDLEPEAEGDNPFQAEGGQSMTVRLSPEDIPREVKE